MGYFTFFEPVVLDPDFTPVPLCSVASWAELVSGMARFGLRCVIISRCELMSLGRFVFEAISGVCGAAATHTRRVVI